MQSLITGLFEIVADLTISSLPIVFYFYYNGTKNINYMKIIISTGLYRLGILSLLFLDYKVNFSEMESLSSLQVFGIEDMFILLINHIFAAVYLFIYVKYFVRNK